ncbi:putative phosphodiesterase [Ereboglobus sp. PH5-5]|uniref:metallophosphoesterase n=1 Tax=Ereboglobus sp. PH5-5 TaxID=2940529 RepID=UPI002404C9C9|nr:metallophosphoesterase [Ereboglobus sp. PH5-5]MDF9832156.1 putative phosphodiesterase [Ereboglobus sp. PH5-5]
MNIQKHRSRFLVSILSAAFLLAAPVAFSAVAPVHTDFERGAPSDIDENKLTTAIDSNRAHSGKNSLRITSAPKAAWGYYSLELDGKLDFSENYDFSVWVYTEKATKISVYISAEDSTGERYTLINGAGAIKPGQWSRLSGRVFAGDWRKQDRTYRFIVRANGTYWIDDLSLRPNPEKTPAQVWPQLKTSLNSAAGKRASTLAPGGTLALDARNAALAPDIKRIEVSLPGTTSGAVAPPIENRESKIENSIVVPDDGLLVFAIDAKDDLSLTGSLQLEPDADLQPGLRVTVLANDTVIAAPAVKADAWKAVRRPRGARTIHGVPEGLRGDRPPATIALTPFRLAKGRNYITVASPHFRSAGNFAKLELRADAKPAEKPLYAFGLLSDTHLSYNRREWRNTMAGAPSGPQLEAVLRQLKREDAAFAIIAGDMTDDARRDQFSDLARVIKRAGLPVYGCIGNHDTSRNSRKDIAATIPMLFPDGPKNTDYAFARPPLRFIVLDGSHWRDSSGKLHDHRTNKNDKTTPRDGALDWLRDTLAKDTTTPTIVVSHYTFYSHGGVSPVSGYDRGNSHLNKNLMAVLDAAPNVVAAMNGHMHYNEVATHKGITCIQNPAFAEWPNAYRVCRVYSDRLEWEVRQLPNRGLIREEFIPELALAWQLSTDEGDLAGSVNLAPRAKK